MATMVARLAIERALQKFSRLVSPEFNRAIERWRQADTEARGGDLLTQAYSDIFSNRSGSVAPEPIDQVARMRARSNELLMEALAMLKARRTATMIPERRTRHE